MINTVKNIGSAIVVLSLGIFILTFFLDKYQLSQKSLSSSGMNDEQQEIILKFTKEIQSGQVAKFNFIASLKSAINKTNKEILGRYSIAQQEINDIISLFDEGSLVKYSTSRAFEYFNENNKSEAFKAKGINDYTLWMDEKEYSSIDELKSEFSNTIKGFNNTIINQKGIDDYRAGQIILQLALNSGTGVVSQNKLLFFFLTYILGIFGALVYILPKFFEGNPGIKNNNIYSDPMNSRGLTGILLGIFLILFYVFLYFWPEIITEWIVLSEIISQGIFNRETSQWFLYGFLYTIAVLVMGLRFLTKYRHNRYQQYRTYSVMFFQLGFAFLIPQVLFALNLPEVDLKNIWPLDYSFFYDWRIESYQQAGTLGLSMMIWGVALIVIGVPALTYFYGKRWYCSWVCGCGGLAETAGDSFRHLSSKKLVAWQIERVLVHSVLVFAVVMTAWVLYTTITAKSTLLGLNSFEVRKIYGFLIGSIFAGVVGTGFYPLMGNRVWCRFGCPLAAYLGIVQKFKSRFRITTNGGQCISCGNCSTYCEMGIDVRWYAQRGQNIIRASCVGCGICAAVCPRGVLKLENKTENGRYNTPELIGNESVINVKTERLSKKENGSI